MTCIENNMLSKVMLLVDNSNEAKFLIIKSIIIIVVNIYVYHE